MDVAIFSERKASGRLNYVLHWIFHEHLGLTYHVYDDLEAWRRAKDAKLYYGVDGSQEQALWIKSSGLLFEMGVHLPNLSLQRWKKHTVLFYNHPKGAVPFDLFAAVFFLISRYEEYLPYQSDRHGRYPAESSTAFRHRFLDEPIIDQWLDKFREVLERELSLSVPKRKLEVAQTFDLDMAWKYRNKTRIKQIGGVLKAIARGKFGVLQEISATLWGRQRDPYFSFPLLRDLHQEYRVRPLFFVLFGKSGRFDRNTPPAHPEMQALVQELAASYEIGIHPSYGSHRDEERLRAEIEDLARAVGRPIDSSRQHFIKWKLPETFRSLIRAGIKHDYSMGYASANGFRAGTSRSFLWYDLAAESVTELRVHPFAFMDATSKFYKKQKPEEAFREWVRLFRRVEQTGGQMTSIWHNYLLSCPEDNDSWLRLYKQVLDFCARDA